jgi:hypothetical protein
MPLTIAQQKALATCQAGSFIRIKGDAPDNGRLVTTKEAYAIFYRMHDDPSVLKEGCPADLDKFALGELVNACRGFYRALRTLAQSFEQSEHARRFWRVLCWLTDDFKREIEHHVGFEFAAVIAPLMDPALYDAGVWPVAAAAASQQTADRQKDADDRAARARQEPKDDPAHIDFISHPKFGEKLCTFDRRTDLVDAIVHYYRNLHPTRISTLLPEDIGCALSPHARCVYLLKPEVPAEHQALFRAWAKHFDPAWVNRGAYDDEPAAAAPPSVVQQTSPAPVAVKSFDKEAMFTQRCQDRALASLRKSRFAAVQQTSPVPVAGSASAPVAIKPFDKEAWLLQRCQDNALASLLVPNSGFFAPADPESEETQAYKAHFAKFMNHVCFREFLPTFPRAEALHLVVCWYYETHGTPPTSTPDIMQMYKVMDFDAAHKPLLEPDVPADYQQVFKEWATHCNPYWDEYLRE